MRGLSYTLIVMFVTTLVATATAEIFRWKDDDGNVIFSDTPQPGAEKIELGETTIVPATPTTAPSDSAQGEDAARAKAYQRVAIKSPEDGESIRNNALLTLDVTVEVQPPLQTPVGHALQLLFDGVSVGEPGRKLKFTLPDVHRGAHTLQAIVQDADGRVLKRSKISNFFVHKQITNPPARRAP